MRYRRLGQSGLVVSELCLGTMTFGGSGEDLWSKIGQLDQEAAERLLGTAIEAGINFIDTANVYAGGASERILGQALKNLGTPREELVIATKVLGAMGSGPNRRGASRGHILTEIRASLERLQLDYVDLYQIHGFDPVTPIEETLAALDTLVEHGHVRHVGLSNWAAWQVMKAVGLARARELAPILSLQAYYTLVGRDLEREIVPMLRSEGLGLLVWSPLAGGLLSGKYTRDEETAGDGRRAEFDFPPVDRDRAWPVIDAMRDVASAHGCSVAQVAIAWLLRQDVVTSVIVGARRVEQLSDNIGATEVRLSDDELSRLDELSALPPEYPGWMLERQGDDRLAQLSPASDA